MAQTRKVEGNQGAKFKAVVRCTGYPDTYQTFPTKRDAKEWAEQLERDIRDRKVDPHRLAQRMRLMDALDIYLPEIKGTKNFKDTNRLCNWWKIKLGTALLSDLTAVSIHQRLDTPSCSGSTKNRYLGALSGCLSHVSKAPYGWIAGNPCRDVPRRKEGKARERILTEAEWNKLIKHVGKKAKKAIPRDLRSKQLPTYLRLAYATGRRRGELLKLRWVDVDLEEGLLYLMDTKSSDDQVVPIKPETIELLKKHEEEYRVDGGVHLFSGRFKNKPTAFDEVLRPTLRELFPPDRNGEVPVLHSIRRTVATELGEGGATESQIMSVTGHKSSASVNCYVKKTVESARAGQAKRH